MPDPHITVASFNLRVDTGTCEPVHNWSARRPQVSESIRRLDPDILGAQEALLSQLMDLRMDLPDYSFIGQGREGGSQGEFGAIFYQADRFALVDGGYFWLSNTPDMVTSSTWGNRYKRMTVWVRFSDQLQQRN